MKHQGVALHFGKLKHGALVVVGLAECFAAESADLIGTDHDAAGIVFGNGTGLGYCQAQRKPFGGFAFKRRFVNA